MGRSFCSKDLYCTFLKVTSQRYSALSLSEVAPIELSHDTISRWLENSHCHPKDIWREAKPHVLGTNGVIIADETVLNKSRSKKIKLVRWQYSGDEHDIIRGIGMLNFLWVDGDRKVCPMDVRIYEPPEDGKTKNDHFRELLINAKRRGVKPEAIIADSWYSSLNNLKAIREQSWNWVMGLRKNRVVNRGQKLEELTIGLHRNKYTKSNKRTNQNLGTETLGDRSLSPRAQTDLWSGALSVTHRTSAEKSHCTFGTCLDQIS